MTAPKAVDSAADTKPKQTAGKRKRGQASGDTRKTKKSKQEEFVPKEDGEEEEDIAADGDVAEEEDQEDEFEIEDLKRGAEAPLDDVLADYPGYLEYIRRQAEEAATQQAIAKSKA